MTVHRDSEPNGTIIIFLNSLDSDVGGTCSDVGSPSQSALQNERYRCHYHPLTGREIQCAEVCAHFSPGYVGQTVSAKAAGFAVVLWQPFA